MRFTDPTEYRQRRPNLHAISTVMRHWFALLLAALLCGAAVFALTLQRPVVHQADSSLIFRFGKEYFPGNAAITAWKGEPIRVFVDEAMHTEMEILGSRRVLAATLRRFPPEQRVAEESGIDNYAADRLSIKRVDGTYLVKVAYQHQERGMTEAFVNILLKNYLIEREGLLANDPSQTLAEAELAAGSELARLRAERAELTVAGATPDAGGSSVSADTAALDTELTLTEERYRHIAQLRGEYQLAAQIEGARGPVIEVLDAPQVAPDPIGISPLLQAIIVAFAALIALSATVFAWVWLKIAMEQPKQADDFLQYFAKTRPSGTAAKSRTKEEVSVE